MVWFSIKIFVCLFCLYVQCVCVSVRTIPRKLKLFNFLCILFGYILIPIPLYLIPTSGIKISKDLNSIILQITFVNNFLLVNLFLYARCTTIITPAFTCLNLKTLRKAVFILFCLCFRAGWVVPCKTIWLYEKKKRQYKLFLTTRKVLKVLGRSTVWYCISNKTSNKIVTLITDIQDTQNIPRKYS